MAIRTAALIAAACTAPLAMGEISITFDDPGSGAEFTHTAPGGAGGTGDLDFRGDIPVDLQLVGTGAAAFLGTQNFSAFLQTDFEVGAITSSSGGVVTASIGGSFQWVDAGSGDVILSGAFVDAAIITFGLAGTIVTSSDISGGSLAYTAGTPLTGLGVTTLVDPQDGVWTLTEVQFLNGTSILDFGTEQFFNSFTANAAFTGTAQVPTPGAAALVGVAGLAAVRRRR